MTQRKESGARAKRPNESTLSGGSATQSRTTGFIVSVVDTVRSSPFTAVVGR
jgi:hypothetical protein